ncbi:type IV secretion system protein [Sphingomonas sp. CARO-RG-8B-R24-01]|uniref:virB8 family protein n=1 Tax=Sphingomonas sp. CARO-RG-8B-R24-01 TaxID=2914831 RepID=UPI001F5A03EC|nr:type IV secretion system protein [Sphingomonas sp. CARO-RG-8B-R24-01]
MREYTKAERKQLEQNALDWQRNDVLRAKRSVRLAWTVASVASLLAIVSVGAVAMLAPLKRVEPFVIQVDRSTGQTSIVPGLSGTNPMSYDVSVKRYFISQYVKDREGWIPLAENEMFEAVLLMSGDEEKRRYSDFFGRNDPASPQHVFKDTPMASIDIRSISFINENVAEVHYSRTVYSHVGLPLVSRYVATLTFKITNRPQLERDLNVNPIGFTVVSYQTSPEV